MPPAQIVVQTSTVDGKTIVCVQVAGYRFCLESPNAERARQIAWDVVRSLGLAGVAVDG